METKSKKNTKVVFMKRGDSTKIVSLDIDYQYIENYISNFIQNQILERVHLAIFKNIVQIVPDSKRSCDLLSMFWLKVLRHKNNFPTSSVSYHAFKDKDTNQEKIFILVEEIMIVVNINTGVLEIEGHSAHQWFKRRFLDLLRRYIGYTGVDEDKIEEEEKLQLESMMKSKGQMKILHPNDEFITSLEMEHLRNLWLYQDLDFHLGNIATPSLKNSHSFIYRLWKSLLNRWLSNHDITVYITTKELDGGRLRDICDLSLVQKNSGQIRGIYVPFVCQCFPKLTLSNIRDEVNRSYSPSQQIWAESKVFEWLTTPDVKVGVNFIAGSNSTDLVEILLTSANFTGDYFEKEVMCSVHFLRMSKHQFEQDFLHQLHTSKEFH